jgi:hypothetical protein
LDKKCEALLETLKTVPTNMVLRLFKEASENLDGLPEDREILKFYRFHYASQGKPTDAPRLTHNTDHGYLDDLEKRYPKFKDFVGLMRERPDAEMPPEAQKVFWKMMSDHKNFNHIPDTRKKGEK